MHSRHRTIHASTPAGCFMIGLSYGAEEMHHSSPSLKRKRYFFLSLVVILRLWGNKCGNVAMQKKEKSPADAEQEEEKGA